MQRATLLAALIIIGLYSVTILVWLIVVGGRLVDGLLLLLLGLPIAALALWWSGRNSRQGS